MEVIEVAQYESDKSDEEVAEENDGNKFRIFISSLRLLNIISMSSHLCSDATYKLVCPAFFKNYICKHAVGMAIRLKYCKPPPAAAKTVPIGEKRKRGTPAKAKLALLVQ